MTSHRMEHLTSKPNMRTATSNWKCSRSTLSSHTTQNSSIYSSYHFLWPVHQFSTANTHPSISMAVCHVYCKVHAFAKQPRFFRVLGHTRLTHPLDSTKSSSVSTFSTVSQRTCRDLWPIPSFWIRGVRICGNSYTHGCTHFLRVPQRGRDEFVSLLPSVDQCALDRDGQSKRKFLPLMNHPRPRHHW